MEGRHPALEVNMNDIETLTDGERGPHPDTWHPDQLSPLQAEVARLIEALAAGERVRLETLDMCDRQRERAEAAEKNLVRAEQKLAEAEARHPSEAAARKIARDNAERCRKVEFALAEETERRIAAEQKLAEREAMYEEQVRLAVVARNECQAAEQKLAEAERNFGMLTDANASITVALNAAEARVRELEAELAQLKERVDMALGELSVGVVGETVIGLRRRVSEALREPAAPGHEGIVARQLREARAEVARLKEALAVAERRTELEHVDALEWRSRAEAAEQKLAAAQASHEQTCGERLSVRLAYLASTWLPLVPPRPDRAEAGLVSRMKGALGLLRTVREKVTRHPAWSPAPPGHCPVCKARPDEDCDAGLHS